MSELVRRVPAPSAVAQNLSSDSNVTMSPNKPKVLRTYPANSRETLVRLQQPASEVFEIVLDSKPDNRISRKLISACILPALDDALELSGFLGNRKSAAVVISSALPRFFSSGTDLNDATCNLREFFEDYSYPLLERLLCYPLPTICAINGYCFTTAFCIALACDHRVFDHQDGLICMSEVDLGLPIPLGMLTLIRGKVPPSAFSSIILGHQIKSQQALRLQIVDTLSKNAREDAINMAQKMSYKAATGACFMIKSAMWDTIILPRTLTAELNLNDQKLEDLMQQVLSRRMKIKL